MKELQDVDRVLADNPRVAVHAKAKEIRRALEAAEQGFQEVEPLLAQLPPEELGTGMSAVAIADMRVALIKLARGFSHPLLIAILLETLTKKGDGEV